MVFVDSLQRFEEGSRDEVIIVSIKADNNEEDESKSTPLSSLSSITTKTQRKIFQLVFGSIGIYSTYLYYSVLQEDLFRYRDSHGVGFSFVWFLQVVESAMDLCIGRLGRKAYSGGENFPRKLFFKSGASQLAGKVLMSLSLAAGLSFPIVVLAKSAKIVPVMLGQLILGGSNYTTRDYIFAGLLVCGTTLLSIGKSSPHETGNDTIMGLFLIILSLLSDGVTGGLQKKLKKETAHLDLGMYDFLYHSHISMMTVALVACHVTGEIWSAPQYILENPSIARNVLMVCLCSAAGQCFIFYVITAFDPLICTTITTTRKMFSVLFSLCFKGHILSEIGFLGMALAILALAVEVEGKISTLRRNKKPIPRPPPPSRKYTKEIVP
jgi:UDP-galactose transporter B1